MKPAKTYSDHMNTHIVRRPLPVFALAAAAALAVASPSHAAATNAPTRAGSAPAAWRDLLEGRSLTNWTVPPFPGAGAVSVKEGAVHIAPGDGCSGITYTGEILRADYELEVVGMRVSGGDFWCGLTFAIGPDPITLVLGGWGGSLVGLSSLDGMDASENETSTSIDFQNGRWYTVNVQVRGKVVEVRLDGKRIIRADTATRRVGIRSEVEMSVPLGITTWQTHGAIRSVRLRPLPPEE